MPCLLGKLADPPVSLRLEPSILSPEQKAIEVQAVSNSGEIVS